MFDSANKSITESPVAMRWMTSAISGATETWRILVQACAAGTQGEWCWSRPPRRAQCPLAMRSIAGPEKTGWVQ